MSHRLKTVFFMRISEVPSKVATYSAMAEQEGFTQTTILNWYTQHKHTLCVAAHPVGMSRVMHFW